LTASLQSRLFLDEEKTVTRNQNNNWNDMSTRGQLMSATELYFNEMIMIMMMMTMLMSATELYFNEIMMMMMMMTMLMSATELYFNEMMMMMMMMMTM
jgi:hypothetical protein